MVSMSLEYDVVKEKLIDSSDEFVREAGVYDNLVQTFPIIERHCLENSFFDFDSGYGIFNVPCEVVPNGVDAVFYYTLGEFVMNSYYDDYNCSFLQCWEETKSPNFLISEKTKNYSSAKVYFLILASLVLTGLMFFLIEKRSNLPFIVGGLLIVISLIFMKLDSVLYLIEDKMIVGFVSVFLTKTYSVFVRLMSIGVGIFTVGIILKFFGIGFNIHRFVKWVKKKTKERKKKKFAKLKSLKKGKKGELVVGDEKGNVAMEE
jgi:hypothetical protein